VGEHVPALDRLGQNVPNPFNPATSITFTLAEPGPVRLEVFDLAGHRVRVLAEGPRRSGAHTLRWDGTNDDGRALGSGTYIYRLGTREGELSRKATLVR
jgi:flagellar hook assembly protein FlgD